MTWLYFLLIVGFLVFIKATAFGKKHFDSGPVNGAAPYPFWDRASLGHALGCAAAASFAMWVLNVPPVWALALTIAGGIGYEAVNGKLTHRGSWYDVVWDTIGAVVAVVLYIVVTRS